MNRRVSEVEVERSCGMGWRGVGTILEVEEMEVVIRKKVNCSEDEKVWM